MQSQYQSLYLLTSSVMIVLKNCNKLLLAFAILCQPNALAVVHMRLKNHTAVLMHQIYRIMIKFCVIAAQIVNINVPWIFKGLIMSRLEQLLLLKERIKDYQQKEWVIAFHSRKRKYNKFKAYGVLYEKVNQHIIRRYSKINHT